MKKTELKCIDNGPILLSGEWELINAAGKVVASSEGTPVALCRCGSSDKKPFCDGAHKKTNFQSKIG
ncbi:MAG: CDGSH iron-sulfur domain-containing protein [Pseudomonadota bacterium]